HVSTTGPDGRRDLFAAARRILRRFISHDRGAAVQEGNFDVAELVRRNLAGRAFHRGDGSLFVCNTTVTDHDGLRREIGPEELHVFVLPGFPKFLLSCDDHSLTLRAAHTGLGHWRRRW